MPRFLVSPHPVMVGLVHGCCELKRKEEEEKVSWCRARQAPSLSVLSGWGRAVSCKPRRITWLRRIGGRFGALQVGAAPAESVAAGRLGTWKCLR